MSEVVKVFTVTPGMMCAMITTKIAVIRIRMIKFMFLILNHFKSNQINYSKTKQLFQKTILDSPHATSVLHSEWFQKLQKENNF